jgi:hypothetical protein
MTAIFLGAKSRSCLHFLELPHQIEPIAARSPRRIPARRTNASARSPAGAETGTARSIIPR